MRAEWENRSLDSALRVPDDIILYCCGIFLYVVFYHLVKRVFSEWLIKKLSKVDKKKIDRKKFTRALWKVFCFDCLSICGIISLYAETWMLTPIGITMQWPGNITPTKINVHYVIETVYYTGSFITMFLEEKQSDFYLMIYHHAVTLILVGFSYRYNFLRYGVFIMFLHDISDPWMDSAKIAVYLGYQSIGDFLFLMFAVMFIVPRIFIYLFMILIPGYNFLWEFGSKLLVPIWGLLLGLIVLNSYWSVLILRMGIEFVRKGRVEKDIRDVPTTEPKRIKAKAQPKKEKKSERTGRKKR